MDGSTQHLKRLGARLLSEANDLKRTPAAMAKDLGLEDGVIDAVIAGEADLETAKRVIWSVCERYPVPIAEVWVEADDTEAGVRVVRAKESAASSRVFDRRDRTQALTPYYEYRDTAMSRNAPFKPEWIKELRVVTDSKPDNPDVAFNNGHLLHQTTFFIGPVNFYWEVGGKRYCREMDTGDSNYITPFVPHSFTTRDPSRDAIIIAVTYGGEVQRALSDLSRIGAGPAANLAGDLREDKGFARRLARQLAAESLSRAGLAARLVESGMDSARAQAVSDGGEPSAAELPEVAAALHVRPADLMGSRLLQEEEVVLTARAEQEPRPFPTADAPAYFIRELARSRHQPYLKGFELEIAAGGAPLEHGLHEYIFNCSDAAVELSWGDDGKETLAPGDSAYVQPCVRHAFARAAGQTEPARLVVIRIPGNLGDAVIDEFAAFARDGRARAAGETTTWFST
ncbi:MAG: hypothetical protein AAF721_01225 [Myxococcota bacterium]